MAAARKRWSAKARLRIFWNENRDWLRYDAETGLFHRLVRRGRWLPGPYTGSLDTYGYVNIKVGGLTILAHRLAWAAAYDEEPAEIDHINGCRSDNRLSNLRLASRSQNCANTASKGGVSGFKGVTPWKGRWRAQICVGLKKLHIGMFDTPEEAHAAYAERAKQAFGDFARLS